MARGVRLNKSEATALLAAQLHELIRDGDHSVAQLMNEGKKMLGRRHVLPSVVGSLHEIMVEGTFKEGTYLVTVHQPICTDDGDLGKALRGSFLPIPDPSLFSLGTEEEYKPMNQPGAIRVRPGKIVLNPGRERTRIKITNTGDRPIQVGSHYHLTETNPALSFDRGLAYGKRLDIPAGTAVRFEPGDVKTVACVEIAGKKIIAGGNNLATGPVDSSKISELLERCEARGFKHVAASA